MKGYWQLTLAQLKLFARNKTVIFWTTLFPLLLMITLGLFLGGGGSVSLQLGWVDQDQTAASQELKAAMGAQGAFVVEDWSHDAEGAKQALKDGELSIVLVVPEGYGQSLSQEEKVPPLSIFYDEVDQSEAQLSFALVESVLDDLNKELVQFEERVTYEKFGIEAANLTYIDFLVPGIVALMIMSSNMNGVAAQIASWRERQILRRFEISGVRSRTFIAAQITARMILNITQSLLVLFVGIYLLGAQMNGSWLLLLFYIILGILVFLSIGFIIAGLSKTPEHAAPVAGFISFPMFFLGGIFFPINNMPQFLQPVVYALPISHLADALRQVMNVGYGLVELWLPTLVLMIWFIASFAISAWAFKWE
jgi:ABC-2 type transport system permease protein